MTALKLKRFIKIAFLKRLGRELLLRILGSFQKQLDANGLTLPPPTAPDTVFFNELLELLLVPEKLPPELLDALAAIDDMSSPQGLQAIESSSEWPALRERLRPDSSA
jgi:hypothetical protein